MKPGEGAPRSLRDRHVADGFFLIQVVGATAFGVAQFRVMRTTVEGVTTSWFGFWLAFLLINLTLAVSAQRAKPGRVTRQTVIIYAVWTAVITVALLMLLYSSGGQWTTLDTITAGFTLTGMGAAITLGRPRGIGPSDPMMRATFAVLFRGIPQLTLAWNVWLEGGAGLSLTGILAGHVIITLRLCQVLLSIREAGRDRNRIVLAVAEAANELTWIVVTAVWAAVTL